MKKAWFLAAAVVALATAAPFAAFSQETPPTEAVVGKLAPEIQVGEWIGSTGLNTLADLRGDVVFIEFWGTH